MDTVVIITTHRPRSVKREMEATREANRGNRMQTLARPVEATSTTMHRRTVEADR